MNRPDPHRRVQDIPRFTQKLLNLSSHRARKSSTAKDIFEAKIRQNTARDEGRAPKIHVVNNVDNADATPPFEFHYSNEYWFDTDVPPPDYDKVQGCGCIGPCDPRSETCSCVRLQESWNDDEMKGFIYDEKGCLKQPTIPAFECNWKCGCDDDCPNRVSSALCRPRFRRLS
jgi:histone-lysine N-methyltransferase SUV39H